MRTVWKFPLLATERQSIRMPKGAIVRHVAMQHDILNIWAEIPETDVPSQDLRVFWIVGTGEEVSAHATTFIATVQVGAFVFHVYEGV